MAKIMKKFFPIAAGIILGLLFIMAAVTVLFKLVPMPEIPKETPAGMFMGALRAHRLHDLHQGSRGGILVAIPKSRNIGLLILGPFIVNIIAYHAFIMGGDGIFDPMLMGTAALALYLLWVERKAFGGLWNRTR